MNNKEVAKLLEQIEVMIEKAEMSVGDKDAALESVQKARAMMEEEVVPCIDEKILKSVVEKGVEDIFEYQTKTLRKLAEGLRGLHDVSMAELRKLKKGQENLDKRMVQIGTAMRNNFERIDKGAALVFERLWERFDEVADRLDRIDRRLNDLDEKIDEVKEVAKRRY